MMKRIFYIAFMALILGFSTNATATTLTFNLGGCDFTPDTGGTGCLGGSGADLFSTALVMTFTETTTDTVRLTIDGTNLGGTGGDANKLSDIWFNIDPARSISSFSYISGVMASGTSPGSFNLGGNAGNFDVNIAYSTSGENGAFPHGSTSVYDLVGTGLTANSFNFLSDGSNPFNAAMHVNKSGNGNSGHYGSTVVPVPAAVWLFSSALIGLAAFKHNNRNV